MVGARRNEGTVSMRGPSIDDIRTGGQHVGDWRLANFKEQHRRLSGSQMRGYEYPKTMQTSFMGGSFFWKNGHAWC